MPAFRPNRGSVSTGPRGGAPVAIKPVVDRVLPSYRIVPCPDCTAPEGEACTSSKGTEMRGQHISRKRIAIRHARQEGLL